MTLPNLETPTGSRSRTGAFDFESAPAFLLYVGRAVTLIAVTLAPWFFGCVRAREQVWLYTALLIAAVIATIVVTIRSFKTPDAGSLRVPLLVLPMIAGLGLGAFQLMPAKQQLTGSRVEQSEELKQWDMGEPITSNRYSFYPHYTMLEIARYSFATIAFLVGYTLFRTPDSQRLLWGTLAINGVVLVVFGLVQQFSWNEKLFWVVDLSNGGYPFASFVNRNNAMSFVCVTFSATMGLLVYSVDRRPIRSTQGLLASLAARIAELDVLQVALLLALALLGCGVVASASRSGALSCLVSLAFAVVFIAVRRRSAWPFLLFVAGIILVGGVILSLQVQERLKERIAEVDLETVDKRARVRHARDALQVTQTLPLTGSGLGTHRYAYLPFVSEFGRLWAVNADNQYVELAVEAGAVGMLLLVLLLLLSLRLIWAGRVSRIESSGAAVVVLFLLCSQAIHALFDFGIILPATLTTASLILGTAAASIGARTGGKGASIWGGRFALPSIALALSALCLGGVNVCQAASKSEQFLAKTRSMRALSDSDLNALIDSVASLPGAEVRREKARLLIHRYERMAAIEVANIAPDTPEERVKELASLEQLHFTVQRLRRQGRLGQVELIRGTEPVARNLPAALASLHEATRLCPILPDSFVSISRLEGILSDNAEDSNAFRAVLLEPYDDRTVARIGIGFMGSPSNGQRGRSLVRHGLATVRPQVQYDVLREVNGRFGLGEELTNICPRDGFAAIRLAKSIGGTELKQHAEAILQLALYAGAGEENSLESLLTRAEVHRQLRQPSKSRSLYERATSEFPESAEAYYLYAKSLRDSDELAAALVAARVAVGLDPNRKNFLSLLDDLSSRADGVVGTSAVESQPGTSRAD